MMKNKYVLLITALAFLLGSAKSQNLKVGTSIVGIGANYCDYTFSSTNLCYLTSSSGSMSGVAIAGSYNYAVLKNVTLAGTAGFSILPGAIGIDLAAGIEYHIHFGHTVNKFDLYIPLNVGFAYINVNNHSVSIFGTFKADGILYDAGLGLRRFFKGNFGAFINGGYAVHNYFGGQVTESENRKLPCTLGLSGFFAGGGICRRFGSDAHALVDQNY